MIVALAGQKGGSGKTTAAVCVAAELLERGARVLLVDGDPQLSARVWAEVATERGHACPVAVALGATGLVGEGQLPRLGRDYDHVIIDCPPAHGEIQRAAMMAADIIVIPAGQGPTDAWALASTAKLVREAQALRPALVGVVLLARVQGRTVLGQGARLALEGAGLPVLESKLTLRVSYQEALAAGQGVTAYSPEDVAAAEVRALCDELLVLAPRPKVTKKGGPRGRQEPKKEAHRRRA